MFGSKKSTPNTASTGMSPNSINSLVKGTVVEGTINADNDFRIDGKLQGKLNCKGRVIIGASGSVTGEINCANAVIEGAFDGNLKVNELLSVKETANVTGEITVGTVNVDTGAVFNVSCNTGASVKKMSTKEAIKIAN
jgi:cytoskeletal protein CcmA (bactofilin family)